MTQLNFDATQIAPDTGAPEAVPAGWYNVMLEDTEMRPTKDQLGAYLWGQMNILDGQYAGRKLFMRLNLKNTNAQAVEIAFKQLSAICHACNVLQVADSTQLHSIPFKVKAKYRAANEAEGWDATNDLTAFKNINDTSAGSPAQAAPAQPAMTPAQPPAAGWQQPGTAQPPANAWQQPPAAAPAQAAPAPAQPAWQPPATNAPPQPWQAPPAAAPVPQQPVQQPPMAAPQPVQQPPAAQPPAEAQPDATAPTQPSWAVTPPEGGAPVPAWAQPPAGT